MNKEVIVTEDLSKTYGKGDLQVHALRKTNISIKQGDYIAIIGPSGSGKSTLIKLLMILYDPTEGAVYVDDIDIREMDLTALRDNIGVIEQEVFLFSKTIRENMIKKFIF